MAVPSGGTITLTGIATDSLGHALNWQVTDNGARGNFQEVPTELPNTSLWTWTAPGNPTFKSVIHRLGVSVSCQGSPSASSSAQATVTELGYNGNYTGLFYVTGDAAPQPANSGAFSFTVSDKGIYTGKLLMAGASYSLKGTFDANGLSQTTVARPRQSPLAVGIHLDLWHGTDEVQGTVSDGQWTASLVGHRALFDGKYLKAPQAGSYTLSFTGSQDAASAPPGFGIGSVTVDAKGWVSFKGTLADGTTVSQGAILSKHGQWPFFLSLYQGQGLVIGWIQFRDQPHTDADGTDIRWIKLPRPKDKYYPAGFQITTPSQGSKFIAPKTGQTALPAIEGTVELSDGNLVEPMSNSFKIDKNKFLITGGASNKLTLTLTTTSGLLSGSFKPPGQKNTLLVKGAIIQKTTHAHGFFLGTNQGGTLILTPRLLTP
jgi:hypothetical protein